MNNVNFLFIIGKHDTFIILQLNKGSNDASVHSEPGLLSRCDIEPKMVERSGNEQTFLYKIYVIYYQPLII